MSTSIAAYCRVSTEDQAREGLSLAAQEDRIRAFCAAQGWTAAEVYVDDGYSGKNLDRPALRRLILDAGKKAFEIVVVYKLDRLSRRQRDVMSLLEDVFGGLGIGFRSVTEAFETTTPFGKAALGMLAVFAQLERETIIERTKMGKLQAAKAGRWKGGPVPYGYRYDPVRGWSLVPEEIEVYRRIYRWYACEDMGVMKIARRLNEEGIPSPSGGHWGRSAVFKIIKNPHYAGLTRHRDQVYPGGHPAVLSEAEWTALQAAQERHRSEPWVRSDAFLLSRVLRCARCGGPVKGRHIAANRRRTGASKNSPDASPTVPKYIRYYVCRDQFDRERRSRGHRCDLGWHRADQVESDVLDQILGWTMTPDELRVQVERQLSGAQPRRAELAGAIEGARTHRREIDQKLKRWGDAFEEGAVDAVLLQERTRALRLQQDLLSGQITGWEVELTRLPDPSAESRELVGRLADVRALWSVATPAQRQRWVSLVVESALLNPDGSVTLRLT